MKGQPSAETLQKIYRKLSAVFGPQHWWPGETPFEVIVGAILTQNTAWTNAAAAIENLKRERLLAPSALKKIPVGRLARLIRSSGYFNQKARRLKSFVSYLNDSYQGDLQKMRRVSLARLRNQLLGIFGIGPETADSILLYAGGHASFVIDAYTRRIFARHRWCGAAATYDELRELCQSALNEKSTVHRLDYWQDYHAQLVIIGKEFCRPRNPRCDVCPLNPLLPK